MKTPKPIVGNCAKCGKVITLRMKRVRRSWRVPGGAAGWIELFFHDRCIDKPYERR